MVLERLVEEKRYRERPGLQYKEQMMNCVDCKSYIYTKRKAENKDKTRLLDSQQIDYSSRREWINQNKDVFNNLLMTHHIQLLFSLTSKISPIGQPQTQKIHDILLHTSKVTVSSFEIIVPYFFKETLLGQIPRLLVNEKSLPQQDGWCHATCHFAAASKAVVNSLFPNRFISKYGTNGLSSQTIFPRVIFSLCIMPTYQSSKTVQQLRRRIR